MKANQNRARRASKDGKRNEMKLKTNEPENGKQGINERDKAQPFCIPLTETFFADGKEIGKEMGRKAHNLHNPFCHHQKKSTNIEAVRTKRTVNGKGRREKAFQLTTPFCHRTKSLETLNSTGQNRKKNRKDQRNPFE
ncbi:hypothetical protein QL285_058151 [Trifolium repens]|nr:hypothetical protein QL285_058151 [Trifolium repens]